MRFERGQTVVRRGLHADGRVASVECATVVSDDDRGLLTWTGPGSDVTRRSMLDGRPTRYLSLDEKLHVPTLTIVDIWRAGTLILTPPADTGETFSVWWFFTSEGGFEGWYVNLESPAARWWGGIDYHDHALDIIVRPDRTWEWKDEDEFAERTGRPNFWDVQRAERIRARGENVIETVRAGAFPFDGTWLDFQPDPAWEPARLPYWWDRVSPLSGGPGEPA